MGVKPTQSRGGSRVRAITEERAGTDMVFRVSVPANKADAVRRHLESMMMLLGEGVKIKVWDAENKTSDGFDGWYNPENAVEELNTAIGP